MANKTKFERNLEEKLNKLADYVRPALDESDRFDFNHTGFFYCIGRFNILQAVAVLTIIATKKGVSKDKIKGILE